METMTHGREQPAALSLLAAERPRNVGWLTAAGLLFGDWGTSRLYVLGLAFLFAGHTSFWLILMMSALILAVGWAYAQICRIYPDGGGVYTAAKHRSRTLAVIGALLLFADYSVTASLSSLDAFHYFGLPIQAHAQVAEAKKAAEAGSSSATVKDAGDTIVTEHEEQQSEVESLAHWDSPGLWAIIAIALIGVFNLMGPKHTGGFAIFAAIGMVGITLLIVFSALVSGKVDWHAVISGQRLGNPFQHAGHLWIAFVSIVLALSGVEAIANLTGVMRKPVAHTARRAIWVVAGEVAVFNIILAVFMCAIYPLARDRHVTDMLAFLTSHYVGNWGEWAVRIVGGLLLLSATNTALTDMISVQYLMARDAELPQFMVTLNRFGVPYVPAFLAAGAPILILVISHDLESLAALYAIGVVGAVAINVTLCSVHPRLRRLHRKGPMLALGIVLLAIWITLAFTKLHALIFVCIVLAVGLTARAITRYVARRRPKPSLLRQAILEQLPADALARARIILGTYGSETTAAPALEIAKNRNSILVVCFIRNVSLSYKYDERRLTLDTDLAAQKTFAHFLKWGHAAGVVVMPIYDSGPDAAELLAENAAIHGCERVLIGTSRQGALYHLIKGHFQRRLEQLLPPEIPVQVVGAGASPPTDEAAAGQVA
jgi:amino acid transporter